MQYLGKNKVSSIVQTRSGIIPDLSSLIPQHIIAFPISRGRFVNFVAFEFHPDKEGTHFDGPWVTDVDSSYVQELVHGWEKDVSDLVQVSSWPVEGRKLHRVLPKVLMILFSVFRRLDDISLGD